MDSIPPDLSAPDLQTAQVLESAANRGDLTTVTTILSQWPTQPSPDPMDFVFGPKPAGISYQQDLWPFTLVLYIAIEESKPQLVSYVLSRGLKPEPFATLKALDVGSIEIFQALFDNGWEINAPLAPNMSPPLWSVGLSLSLVSLSFQNQYNSMHATRTGLLQLLTTTF